MNSKPNLSSTGDVISVKIEQRNEVYYPVTSREMRNIRNKSLFVDLFTLLFSLFIGAFMSVIVTKPVIGNLPVASLAILNTYQWLFLVIGLIFLLLDIWFYIDRNRDIAELRSST